MKLSVLATLCAALFSLYYIIQLPYIVSILLFSVFALLAYIGYSRNLKLAGYAAFFGFLILFAIMSGYYADVKGVGGNIMPAAILGSIGTLLIIFEELKPPTRQ